MQPVKSVDSAQAYDVPSGEVAAAIDSNISVFFFAEPDVKEPDENPVKKRKPGRPKKCGEEEQAGITGS